MAEDADALDLDLQCSICLEFYFEPLTLQCGHSFCRVCLLQSTKLAPDGRSCPQCRAVISSIKDPLTHPADERLTARVAELIPADKIEDRKAQAEEALAMIEKKTQSAIPVFIMSANERQMRPGAPVNLHFFEPRYRILIRRAWEGQGVFLWATSTPSASDGAAQSTSALLVSVESARFLPDGRANVTGVGMERVTLCSFWVEEGTGGLWYASLSGSSALANSPTRPAGSDRSASAASASREGGNLEEPSLAQTARRLQTAISQGAPAYNRGEKRRCADIYLQTAREELLLGPARAVRETLQEAVTRAETLLGEVDREEGGGGGLSSSTRSKVDSAAWVLRHAFDNVVLSTAAESSRRGRASSARLMARSSSAAAAASTSELPVFYYDGLSLGVGERASFSLFEPRYLVLAEQVVRGGPLVCASASPAPTAGQYAVVARMEACSWQQGGDNAGARRARITVVGVHTARLDAVRECAEHGGLWYAQVETLAVGEGTWGGGCASPKRCTIC